MLQYDKFASFFNHFGKIFNVVNFQTVNFFFSSRSKSSRITFFQDFFSFLFFWGLSVDFLIFLIFLISLIFLIFYMVPINFVVQYFCNLILGTGTVVVIAPDSLFRFPNIFYIFNIFNIFNLLYSPNEFCSSKFL